MSFMKKIWILFFFSFLLIACKNNSHEVLKINAKQLNISNDIKQDSSIIQLFTPYKKKMTNEITKSLSFSPKILERTDGNLQSTLGNLVADLSYEKANELFKNKSPKQHKCNQQIYNTQSQVQHIHAYLHPANTNPSYSIEIEEKLKYL